MTQQQPDVSPKWFYQNVIIPVCYIMGRQDKLQSMAALLLGTALHESHLIYERQVGGPAKGWFQMEPRTHDDLWNYILKHQPLWKGMELLNYDGDRSSDMLIANQFYAAGMALAYYQRVPEALPPWDDFVGQAYYWKKYWNTAAGKGTVEEYCSNWHTYGGAAAVGY